MISPGSTTGLSELASSLMFSTSTPRSCATLFRLKSLVTIFPCSVARQLDQLQIDFAHFGEVHVRDGDVDAGHLLNLLQDVETAPAAIALHRVGRVGDQLQLLEDELRDDDRAVHEAGFADVGDAAVDDDAGVEDLVALARAGRAEQRDEVLRLEPFAAAGPEHQAQVRQREQDEAVQEDHALVAEIRPVERRADRLGRQQADGAAEQRAEHVRDRRRLEPELEDDDQQAEDEPERDVERAESGAERLELVRRIADRRYEQNTRQCEPRHCGLPRGR